MPKLQSPCRYCEKQGCGNHSNCNEYLDYTRRNNELRERIRIENEIYRYAGEEIRRREIRKSKERRGSCIIH